MSPRDHHADVARSNTVAPMTRRGMLAGAAVTTAAATAVAGAATPAEAASKPYRPTVRSYPATLVPDRATLHMANRFSYGYTPALRRDMHQAGGPDAWFHQQLHPQSIGDAHADSFETYYPSRLKSAIYQYNHAIHGSGYIANACEDHARWALMMRTYSNRQLFEVMTESGSTTSTSISTRT